MLDYLILTGLNVTGVAIILLVGKNFGVVAAEVRLLATRPQAAAIEIGSPTNQ